MKIEIKNELFVQLADASSQQTVSTEWLINKLLKNWLRTNKHIKLNVARCHKCEQIIQAPPESTERAACRCGNLEISGGRKYLARWPEGGHESYDELSEYTYTHV